MSNLIESGPTVYQSFGAPLQDSGNYDYSLYSFKRQLFRCFLWKTCSGNFKQNSSKITVIELIFCKTAGF